MVNGQWSMVNGEINYYGRECVTNSTEPEGSTIKKCMFKCVAIPGYQLNFREDLIPHSTLGLSHPLFPFISLDNTVHFHCWIQHHSHQFKPPYTLSQSILLIVSIHPSHHTIHICHSHLLLQSTHHSNLPFTSNESNHHSHPSFIHYSNLSFTSNQFIRQGKSSSSNKRPMYCQESL